METLTICGLLALGIITGLVIDHIWQKRKWNNRMKADKMIADSRREASYIKSLHGEYGHPNPKSKG